MLKKAAACFALVGLMAGAAYAGVAPQTGINGSMHDMNSFGISYTHDKLERTCVFCHTPHNAQKTDVNVPLWNHKNASGPALDPYKWIAPTNVGIAIADPLAGPSRLCMACHDGVTAVDSHGTAGSDVQGTKVMDASYVDGLGNTAKRFIDDLTVTHPIGFTWTDAVAKRPNELVSKELGFITNNVMGNFNSVTRTGMTYSTKLIKDTLYGDIMTCATCHDVHNTVNALPDAGHTYNYFLYAKEEGSAICLSCHIK